MFVYLITNTINGKRYIGQTRRSLSRRWKQHCKSTGCCALNNAIKKYGEENFSKEVIFEPPTIDLMNELEAEYIEKFCTLSPNGYNLKTGGCTSLYSEESRKKISASKIGKKASEEARRNMSKARMGLPCPQKAINALLIRNVGNTYGVGHKISEEHREILKRPRSLETRLKMSKPKSEEHRKKIGLAHVGMKRSLEAIENMKKAQQDRRLKERNQEGFSE